MIDIEIDKLTNSIINRISGDVFDTEVVLVKETEFNKIKKKDWSFDWQKEYQNNSRKVYKLVIENNPNIIQGLISIQINIDHVFVHLVENAIFNKNKEKLYEGVAGNLFAFACKTSFDLGYEGYLAFDAKTALIEHYKKILFAKQVGRTRMIIETPAASYLVNRYFFNKN